MPFVLPLAIWLLFPLVQPSAYVRHQAVQAMLPYIEAHLAAGGRLHQITRHMLGLFHGCPGARGWRQELSTGGARDGAGLEVLDRALDRLVQAAPVAGAA